MPKYTLARVRSRALEIAVGILAAALCAAAVAHFASAETWSCNSCHQVNGSAMSTVHYVLGYDYTRRGDICAGVVHVNEECVTSGTSYSANEYPGNVNGTPFVSTPHNDSQKLAGNATS